MHSVSNFPDYQREKSKQDKCNRENIGKENQKAVLKKGIPIIDSAFHAAVRANQNGVKGTPGKDGKVNGEV